MKLTSSAIQMLKFIGLAFIAFLLEYNLHINYFSHQNIDLIKEVYPNYYSFIPYFYYTFLILSFLFFIFHVILDTKLLKWRPIYREISFYLFFYFLFIRIQPILIVKAFLILAFLGLLSLSFLSQNTIRGIYIKLKESVYKFDSSLIAPLLVTLLLRLLVIFFTDNISAGDAPARLWQSWFWSEIDLVNIKQILYLLMPTYTWLPLQHYITGITIYVTGDLVWSPRIIITLISCITLFPLYGISKIMFNKRVGIIACYFYAFYASMIRVNVLTLSETPFIFFMLSCIYFLLLYYETKKLPHYLYSIICLSFACTLRFESWVLLIALGAVSLLFFQRKHQKWIYFVIPISFISFYLFVTFLQGQNFLRGILYSDWENLQSFALDGGKNPLNVIIGYAEASILGSLLVFFIFLLRFFQLKTVVKIHVFITTILFFIFFTKLFNFTLHPQNRYFVQYIVLIIPFISYYVFKLTRYKILQFFIILFLLTPNFLIIKHKYYNSGRFNFTNGFKESYKYANNSIEKGIFIIDQEINKNADNLNQAWMAYAKIHLDNKNKDKNCIYRVSYEHQKGDYFTFEKLEKALPEASHLVLFENGEMAVELNFEDSIEYYKSYMFYKVFEYDNNFIYEIKQPN